MDEQGCHFSIEDVEEEPCISINDVMFDPLFWQALGKARGWGDEEVRGTILYDDQTTKIFANHLWFNFAEEWFETRLSNGDERAFWQSLP